METGEEPQFLDKAKWCAYLQERLKVQYSELQAPQPIFTLEEKHGGSPLGANLCVDVGSA